MDFYLVILLFIIGLVVIVKGGDFFVDAATWIAEVSGVPKFIIGATIVSIATTLPELFVSSIAAAEGNVDIAIGNAIGSVTANTGLIMSIGVLFMSIVIQRKQFMFKGLLLLVTISALYLLSADGKFTVLESVVLFALFAVFLFENIKSAKESSEEKTKQTVTKKICIINISKFILGTAGIVIGSRLLVDNGTLIAEHLGVSASIIGLTMVAIGTSLPELVTTITAIVKKESSISVGNIIGANIIDCALILPVCSVISGGALPVAAETLRIDMPICLIIAAIMIIPSIIKEKMGKWQGVLCCLIYIAYLVFICVISPR